MLVTKKMPVAIVIFNGYQQLSKSFSDTVQL